MVVTELIHNALEHGLSEVGDLLSVEVARVGSLCTVTISDNGSGLPEKFDLEESSNLGLQIANTLTKNELNGTLKLFSNGNLTNGQVTFSID